MPSPDSDSDPTMKVTINPTRAAELSSNLSQILSRISSTTKSHNITKPIRLVAVSKLKPASDILALHQPPSPQSQSQSSSSQSSSEPQSQIHFGENYIQELITKSKLLPSTIKWHFIGGLQSNKCKELAKDVPNLWAVESVDSIKKAKLLNKGRSESSPQSQSPRDTNNTENTNTNNNSDSKLRIFIQINTSNESNKSGVPPKSPELIELANHIISTSESPHLKLQGLMTIGAIARSQATTAENENEDFITLKENRDWLVEQLELEEEKLELSMGMSEDFEGAIVQGSDEVRVGSTIFGERPAKKDARVLEETEEGKN